MCPTFSWQCNVSIQEIKSDSYYIQRRVASYNKAFNELGYTPKITFSEGIKKTIIWYNKTKEKKT